MSDDLILRTASAIRGHRFFVTGQKILVAVSGGADSMVLLHVLRLLAPQNRWELSVAHFNHHLRGRASNADEVFVRRTAKKMKLRFYVGRADVKSVAARSKISIEMAARDLRHAFFARVARRQGIRTLALAHHADDQVELFFLRLLRGTGGAGLAGMLPSAPSAADPKLTLVRPLLGFTKSELLDYASAAGIAFREDASNRSNDHLRNRIRNELLPLLKRRYQPGLNAAVLRLMEIIGAESALAENAARQWRAESRTGAGTGRAGQGAGGGFAALPAAVQRKVVQQQLIELAVAPDFELVEALRDTAGKWISVRPGMQVARNEVGTLSPRRSDPLAFDDKELRWKLSGRDGERIFGGRKFRWSIKKLGGMSHRWNQRPMMECFDADKVGNRIILRHWRAGDRFQPIGMTRPVKLQDLFVNAKIPVARRRSLVLAATQTGEIFWAENLRIAEPFKLTAKTRRQLVWEWTAAE